MTGVDKDLATLRGFSGPDLAPGYDAALDRLEAKVATLRKERDAARKQSRESSGMYVQANEQITELLQQQSFMERKLVAQRGDIERLAERVMAAEARCARLQQALTKIRKRTVNSESFRQLDGQEVQTFAAGMAEAYDDCRAIAREALAGTDTPAERVTHGRHCSCSACAREDWTRITGPCGMHGADCPAVYAPLPADSQEDKT